MQRMMVQRRRWMAVALAATLLLGACGDDDEGDDDGGDASTETTAAEGGDTTATTAGTDSTIGPEGSVELGVADTDLGTIIVDPEGFSLYVFENDEPGTSTCTDACAEAWPPLLADQAIGSDEISATVATIERPDGTLQVAVNDQPLYRFAADIAAGETTGQGTGDVWYVVAPDGTPIDDD